MEENVKCPRCGGALEADDTIDFDRDFTSFWYIIIGHCSNCKHKFKWNEYYVFDGAGDFEEIEGD